MKTVTSIIFMCFVTFTLAANLPTDQANDQERKAALFSDEAKMQIREASFRAISYLCLDDKTLPEIKSSICSRALSQMYRVQPVTYNEKEPLNSCLDCTIADPVCWDSCPL